MAHQVSTDRFTYHDRHFSTEISDLQDLGIREFPSHLELVNPLTGGKAFFTALEEVTDEEGDLQVVEYAAEVYVGTKRVDLTMSIFND